MNRLLFVFPHRRFQSGYSLAELSVVLGLLAICTSWAVPNLSQWFWRWRVDAVVQAWVGDLQNAKLQALRRGQNLELQRLNSCQTTPLRDGDWRCGWQLALPLSSSTPLFTHQLDGQTLVQLYPGQNQLPINSQGEAVAGGIRLTVQAKNLKSVVRSLCINNTGRIRVVAAEVCT